MSDTKISAELPADTLDGSDLFPVVQGGNNRKATISQIPIGVTGSGTTNTVAKWTDTTVIGDSSVSDNGSLVIVTNPLLVNAPVTYAGDELLANPSFTDNSSSWVVGDCSNWSSGQFVTTLSACSDAAISTTFASISGRIYLVHLNFTISGDSNYVYFDNNSADSGPHGDFGPTQDFIFTADFTGTDTIYFDFYNYNPGATRSITGPISIREISSPPSPMTVQNLGGSRSIISVDQINGSLVLGGSSYGFVPGDD